MGLKKCQINLDNPQNTYYPGQTIRGTVDYEFDAPKKVRGIRVEFLGLAETSWTTTKQTTNAEGKKENVRTVHSGREEYFKMQYYLLGAKNGSDIEIPVGKHSYPFSCTLPPTLPSSFEGEHGHVRYSVKVSLDIPWKSDRETMLAFNVIGHFDMNHNPKYKAPLNLHIRKTFWCCFCKSAPINLDVSFPSSAFYSGQSIPVEITCENGTTSPVDNLIFKLVKMCTYHSDTPYKETKETTVKMLKKEVAGFPANATQTRVETITLPQVPPSKLDNCGIIDLKYELIVILAPSGMHCNKETRTPVVIGTVPLTTVPNANENPSAPLLASAPVVETPAQPYYPHPPATHSPTSYPPPPTGYPPFTGSPNNVIYPNPPYPVAANPRPVAGWTDMHAAPPQYYPTANSPNPGYPYPPANVPYSPYPVAAKIPYPQ